MSRFADASYYIALLNSSDEHHSQAVQLGEQFDEDPRAEIVTSHAVLLEVLAYFSRKGPRLREMAVQLVERQLSSGAVYVVEIDEVLFHEGLSLYRERRDQRYSLADCISMTIARRIGIVEILTTDSDFEAEGFMILMK